MIKESINSKMPSDADVEAGLQTMFEHIGPLREGTSYEAIATRFLLAVQPAFTRAVVAELREVDRITDPEERVTRAVDVQRGVANLIGNMLWSAIVTVYPDDVVARGIAAKASIDSIKSHCKQDLRELASRQRAVSVGVDKKGH